MRVRFRNTGYILLVLVVAACKVPYAPTPVATVTNYLVVEGVINTGQDSTLIKLSRTTTLTNKASVVNELKAKVTVESNQNSTTYALTDKGNGTYAAPALNLSSSNQYRLRVTTSDGKLYLSDFTQAKVTPAIDSVTWTAQSNGLNIFATAHDANNATRYYRWDYTEAWEFHPNYYSFYISNGTSVVVRNQTTQQIWDCFTGDVSSNIIVGSTAKLSQDVIQNQPIAIIPQSSESISVKYSIQVSQYALTEDAYNYYVLLKKNTEQLGSIFDAQPSAATGNVHCLTKPDEVVIGFVTAGTVTRQRIFITKSQLPKWTTIPAYPACQADSVWKFFQLPTHIATEDQYLNFNSGSFLSKLTQQIPIGPIADANGIPLLVSPNGDYQGYLSAAPICVDCTLRGSKTPPIFWK